MQFFYVLTMNLRSIAMATVIVRIISQIDGWMFCNSMACAATIHYLKPKLL